MTTIRKYYMMLLMWAMFSVSMVVAKDIGNVCLATDPHPNHRDSLFGINPVTDSLKKVGQLKRAYPDCSAPFDVRWSRTAVSAQVLVAWGGIDANAEDIRYQVRHRNNPDVAWQSQTVRSGHEVLLDASVIDDQSFEVAVQKNCYDKQSQTWINSAWVGSADSNRELVPCTMPSMPIIDVWSQSARIQIPITASAFATYTNWTYKWVAISGAPPCTNCAPKPFTPQLMTVNGVSSYHFVVEDAPLAPIGKLNFLVVSATDAAGNASCGNQNFSFNFHCSGNIIGGDGIIFTPVSDRFLRFTATVLSPTTAKILVNGHNANEAKGLSYRVIYQPYNVATQTLSGNPTTVIIADGKEKILTNLISNISYKIIVQLRYPNENTVCKEDVEILMMPTPPVCNLTATLGTVTSTTAAINFSPALNIHNYVQVDVQQNGVTIGTSTQVGNGTNYSVGNLNPGTAYTFSIVNTSNGGICPTIVVPFTTPADCTYFDGLDFTFEPLSTSSAKIVLNKNAYGPFSYKVSWKVDTFASPYLKADITTGNSYVLTGLSPFVAYEIVVTPYLNATFCTQRVAKIKKLDCSTFNPAFTDFEVDKSSGSGVVKITGTPADNIITYSMNYKESTATKWTNLLINQGLVSTPFQMVYGTSYDAKVTLKIGNGNCKTIGPKTVSLFDCKDLKSIKADLITKNSVTATMEGPKVDSLKNGIYYKVSLRENTKPVAPWLTKYISTGNTYPFANLKSDTEYELQAELLVAGSTVSVCQPLSKMFRTLIFANNKSTCGTVKPNKTIDPSTPLQQTMVIGDLVTINGMGVEVVTVTGTGGTFSGTGLLNIPMLDSSVYVQFSAIKVNVLKEVIDGQITSVPNPNGKSVHLGGGGTINIGGAICVPKKENEVDGNGFNENGKYAATPPYTGYVAGMPIDTSGQYDPCGFDKNGKHKDTGDDTNAEGCSREDIKKNKAGCVDCFTAPNAYSWLGESGPGAGLYLKVQDSLPNWIKREVIKLIATNKDSISAERIKHTTKRTEMTALATQLEYDTKFLFGQENQYFDEGMSYRFLSRPKLMQFEAKGRNVNTAELEKKHVELYAIDLNLEKFKTLDTLLNAMLEVSTLKTLTTEFGSVVKKMNKADSTKYADATAMKGKIKDFLTKKVYGQLNGLIGFGTPKSIYNQTSSLPSAWTYQNTMPTNVTNNASILAASLLQKPMRRFQQWFGGTPKQEDEEATLGGGTAPLGYYLPYIKTKTIAGQTFRISFDNLKLTPGSAAIDIAIEVPVPNSNIPIAFAAVGVGFDQNGFVTAAGQNPRLELLTDIEIRLTNSMLLTLNGTTPTKKGTYVEFDCEGFAGLGIEADFEVCRNYLLPVNITTLSVEPEPKRVKAHIANLFIKSWDDFMIDGLSIPPFKVVGAEQYIWTVKGVTLDMSSTKKSTIKYPNSYLSVNPLVTTEKWKGFYMAELSVLMPDGLGKDNNLSNPPATGSTTPTPPVAKDPLKIGVKDCIFDNLGFTGELFAENALTLENGTLGGWAFSMDTISIYIEANTLKGGKFSGLVNVPLFKKSEGDKVKAEDCMRYTAAALPGDKYLFRVYPPKDALKVNVWKAKVVLSNTSSITIRYEDKKFITEATLTGDITVEGESSQPSTVKSPSVHFEKMILTNRTPYVTSMGVWELPTQVSASYGGFELEFKKIAPKNRPADKLVGLGFTAKVKLVGGDGLDIAADGDIVVLGKIVEGYHQRWVYEKIELKRLDVDANFSGNKIKGGVFFYDYEPGAEQWGKGFRGYLNARFAGLDADIQAIAQFGRVSPPTSAAEYKYFMVDAMVNLGKGIPLSPGFDMKGFGGGLTYHMKRGSFVGTIDSISASTANPNVPPNMGLGVSLSKVQYTPDPKFGLGLKATIAIAATAEKAFSANVSLEVLMNSQTEGGGVAEIVLSGNARFMSGFVLKGMPSTQKTDGEKYNGAPISAYASIKYNFNLKTLDALLEVRVEAPKQALVGGGQAVLHISKNTWYINIGTPDQRIELTTPIKLQKGQAASGLKLSAYLDIGKNIPKMPNLPANVSALTGLGNIMQNESKRASGKGFAFGARASFGMKFEEWKVYAALNLDAGFDVMVQDYGRETICTNTGDPIGINGWYASGQLYAYVGGNVGIIYKKKQFPIASLAVAMALQAKLPNPMYARGAVAVKYSILGGLVKGSTKVAFEIGEECQIAGGSGAAALQQALIAEIEPSHKQVDVAVMSVPKVFFNVPIGVVFKDDNDNDVQATLISHSLKSLKNNFEVSYNLIWSDDKTSIQLKPATMFNGNDSLELKVKVSMNGGVPEEKSVVFRTSDGFTTIPNENVEFSYPMNGQYNYYASQVVDGSGYIQLVYGQPELFYDIADNDLQVRYRKKGGVYTYQKATYNFDNRRIDFKLPSSSLSPNSVYEFELFKRMPVTEATSAKNIKRAEITLYKLYFRASNYGTFGQKIAAMSALNKPYSNIDGVYRFAINNFEPFDEYELKGGENFEPLVEFDSDIKASPWYNEVASLVYSLKSSYNLVFDDGNNYSQACKTFKFMPSYQKGDVASFTQSHESKYIVTSASDFELFTPIMNNKQCIEYMGDRMLGVDLRGTRADLESRIAEKAKNCYEGNMAEFLANAGLEPKLLYLLENKEKIVNMQPPTNGTYKIQATYRCTRLKGGQPDSVQSFDVSK